MHVTNGPWPTITRLAIELCTWPKYCTTFTQEWTREKDIRKDLPNNLVKYFTILMVRSLNLLLMFFFYSLSCVFVCVYILYLIYVPAFVLGILKYRSLEPHTCFWYHIFAVSNKTNPCSQCINQVSVFVCLITDLKNCLPFNFRCNYLLYRGPWIRSLF